MQVRRAAAVQGRSRRRCAADPHPMFVPHPILNRTTAEIHAIAHAALETIIGSLGPAARA